MRGSSFLPKRKKTFDAKHEEMTIQSPVSPAHFISTTDSSVPLIQNEAYGSAAQKMGPFVPGLGTIQTNLFLLQVIFSNTTIV